MKKIVWLWILVLAYLLFGCVTINHDTQWNLGYGVYTGGGAILRW